MLKAILFPVLVTALLGTARAASPWSDSPTPSGSQSKMRDELLNSCLEYDLAIKRGDLIRARQQQLEIQRNLLELNELVEAHYLERPIRPRQPTFSPRTILTNPSKMDIPYESSRDLDPDTGTYYYIRTRP